LCFVIKLTEIPLSARYPTINQQYNLFLHTFERLEMFRGWNSLTVLFSKSIFSINKVFEKYLSEIFIALDHNLDYFMFLYINSTLRYSRTDNKTVKGGRHSYTFF
jgi:hypothetical protein